MVTPSLFGELYHLTKPVRVKDFFTDSQGQYHACLNLAYSRRSRPLLQQWFIKPNIEIKDIDAVWTKPLSELGHVWVITIHRKQWK